MWVRQQATIASKDTVDNQGQRVMPGQTPSQLMTNLDSRHHHAMLTSRQSSLYRLSVRQGVAYDSSNE